MARGLGDKAVWESLTLNINRGLFKASRNFIDHGAYS